MSTITDVFRIKINTDKKVLKARFLICCIFCILGLFMTTRGGFFVLNLIDTYIAGYPLLIVGLLEVVVVGWIYGSAQFCEDIECMIGKRSKLFWNLWSSCWKYICPSVLIVSFIYIVLIV